MKRRLSLTGQLTLSMATIAIGILLIGFAMFYLVYEILSALRPNLFPAGMPDTSGLDMLIMMVLCIIGLIVAIISAVRLARRIVRPLHAVSLAAERIAEGDLTARAEPESGIHGETALLVANFNAMAGRLESVASEIVTWNAQIAHELRTPLTILKGRLQGVSDGVFVMDEAMTRGLLAQVEGLRRLVEDLRSVSLADSGRLSLEMVEVDLAAELEDLALFVEPMLEKSGFTLSLSLARGTMRLDIARLRQAVLALVDNAQRYADPCDLLLSVTLPPGGAEIALSDAGPGLSPAFEESAFRQFSRGSDAALLHRSGSGLGLSVVQAIARAHGGAVRYERRHARYAFVIALPR